MARGRKTGGRRPGSTNKLTRAFRELLLVAVDEVGGQAALVKWGTENPTEFWKLCGRMIPTEVIGPGAEGEHLLRTTVVHEIHST